MSTSLVATKSESFSDGVILQQLGDLCLVRLGEHPVDAARARDLGERLIAFIEQAGCRKLVMSFEGEESIYGFLLDSVPSPRNRRYFDLETAKPSAQVAAGSDLWLG